MKRTLALFVALLLFSSHDMYLKLDTYFLAPNSDGTIYLYNGTFEQSENVIDRNRMADVSLVGNGTRTRLDTTQWSEKDSMTILNFATGAAGTKVAGVSTLPRNISMEAAAFNRYLKHDGVIDMLEWREKNNALDQNAVEKYAKHVKTIFQVGDTRTDDWQAELGYPIEFIPLSNPYDLQEGDELKVKLLWQGQPLANQLVLADFAASKHAHDHAHGEADDHNHASADDHDHNHDHAGQDGHDHPKASNHDHADGHSHDHADSPQEHGHNHAEEGGQHQHAKTTAPTEDHHHAAAYELRTDEQGIINLKLAKAGIGYLRTIYMIASEEAGLTHESNWATLTFEVDHGHHGTEGEHTHADGTKHTHDDEAGVPSYLFYLGSLVLVVGLFFWFNRKK